MGRRAYSGNRPRQVETIWIPTARRAGVGPWRSALNPVRTFGRARIEILAVILALFLAPSCAAPTSRRHTDIDVSLRRYRTACRSSAAKARSSMSASFLTLMCRTYCPSPSSSPRGSASDEPRMNPNCVNSGAA